ncbi:G1 family glutamic endopeptidase [Caballeronia sp. LZ034LL]|uniref:G1 family glutamic endopeptidase n=1 Tax=Caballeronia sp. LZ034LL TaxID=3038567 RepID=UPI0028667D68|nr:G1 family glutamic endopeptidase [Caballeronia sp. LZ034LL]MDR5839168.1 hypothetical protein [Caballeronia sp. LZ034LL]
MGKSAFKKYSLLLIFSGLLSNATASIAQTSTLSNNWAGYAINDAAYSDVSASWVVPQIDCSSVAGATLTGTYAWVGLGGQSDETITQTTLEQIGTVQACVGSTPVYDLFYEFFPANKNFGDSKYALSAGDTVSAKVSRNLDGSYTLWETATAKDAKSPKWTFSTTGSSPGTSPSDPGNRSAEVIMEQPGTPTDLIRWPVASYGSITFFNIGYTKANTATDHATSIQFYEPLGGNTLSTQWATPVTLSPTSFIVYQY